MGKTVYYSTFECDMVQNPGQDYSLPEDYTWLREGPAAERKYRSYFLLYRLMANFYCRFVERIHVRNTEVFKSISKGSGAFVYGNHTLTVGDAFSPALANRRRRLWIVCSPANFGLPLIGKCLDWMGALPMGHGREAMGALNDAVTRRCKEGGIITLYPEAHLWPYCSFIRPFHDAAFHYPVALDAPVFSATTVFTRRRLGSKPRITIYYDGPFLPDRQLPYRERRQRLADQVRAAMLERSRLSECNWIEYTKIQA